VKKEKSSSSSSSSKGPEAPKSSSSAVKVKKEVKPEIKTEAKKKAKSNGSSSSSSSSSGGGSNGEGKLKELSKQERLDQAMKAYKWWEHPDLPDGQVTMEPLSYAHIIRQWDAQKVHGRVL